VIVGGSLGGLTTALALAAHGISSTVLERTRNRTQRGVAILVSGAELRRALGPRAQKIVTEDLGAAATIQGTNPHAWWDMYTALRRAAEDEPLVSIVDDTTVVKVGQDESAAWARTDDGQTWRADVVIGADGYRSVVRRHVDPDRPEATYAGYVVWLGQSPVPPEHRDLMSGPNFFPKGREMLAVYPLIEADGEITRFGWGVFDPRPTALLRRIGALEGLRVLHTPRASDVPDDLYAAMAASAETKWDEPWADAVAASFRKHEVIATPITEYVPERVVNGRIAIIGDAAHAQTPMTGAGFEEAVSDASAIASTLPTAPTTADGLARFELLRLAEMRGRVQAGQSFSRAFARAEELG
jgi:2-polyprenyl-6-methoxyphenol hydroxylase-like FAD-dependent oxidoreductase